MPFNASEITHWVIRTDQPFRTAQSFLLPNGTVAYTDGLAPSDYAAERGFPIRVVTSEELDALLGARLQSLITEPVEETEADYWYALEVLPPCKWGQVRGVELFHISERIEGDLVAWHAQVGHRYFTCTDRASADREQLAYKFFAAARAAA
jgi:hypothetical protein